MTILIDTNILVAAAIRKDAYHREALQLLQTIRGEKQYISAPVLSELFYFVVREVDYRQAVLAFERVQSGFEIEALTSGDMVRMQQIMRRYADAEFDYADAAIMAQAERLNITRVATLDRRHFPLFRPAHTEYLELLP